MDLIGNAVIYMLLPTWLFLGRLQACFRSSAFKPVTPKNFSSMQNLYPSSKSEDADHGISNGLHRAYAHVAKAVSTSSSSSSPSRHGGPAPAGNKVSWKTTSVLIQSSRLIYSEELYQQNRIFINSIWLLLFLPQQ